MIYYTSEGVKMKLFDYLFGKKEQALKVNEEQEKTWRDYTYITDYFKEKYIFPESDKYFEWKEKYDIAVENSDLETIKLLTQGKDIHSDTVAIMNFIEFFTLSKQKQNELGQLDERIAKLVKQGYLQDVTIVDEDRIIIKTQNGNIKVKRLSKVIDSDDKSIETLQRKKRCHPETVKLSLQLSNDNNVCTGWVYNLSSYAKYLHSWVEFADTTNSEWCLDFTFNAAIDKSSYYRLFNVDKTSRISSSIIEQEFDAIQDMTNMDGLFLKAYLCNREETLIIYNEKKQEHESGRISPLSRI